MNGMQLVDMLRITEDKMQHLHKAIDHISNDQNMHESVSALTEVVKDYQVQTEKLKQMLTQMELDNNSQDQGQGER
ncbi:hypothetical protein [Brevibacillus dissolubilis]|uniref:hypothetical protein n=1 Tax=Brevibacillus dissolubilis TaxID=1844116 RepID=UPI00111627A9|nr:hypothetical protein [Brevibacillus dissolubilis]